MGFEIKILHSFSFFLWGYQPKCGWKLGWDSGGGSSPTLELQKLPEADDLAHSGARKMLRGQRLIEQRVSVFIQSQVPNLGPATKPVEALLLNETWVHSPTRSKANLLTPGCGEGKCSIYCRAPSKETRTASAQNTRTPGWGSAKHFFFPSKVFLKARWGRDIPGYVISLCTIL